MKRRKALILLGGGMSALASCQIIHSKRSGSMKKEIKTQNAPEAIGPYSQAIAANGFVFASGQIAIDPKTGDLIAGEIEEQTRQVLTNLEYVLKASGSSLAKVVKCTVFLNDLDDYKKMNAVYGDFFPSPFPARAAVEVSRLPKDVKVEIEAIAVI